MLDFVEYHVSIHSFASHDLRQKLSTNHSNEKFTITKSICKTFSNLHEKKYKTLIIYFLNLTVLLALTSYIMKST